MTDNKLSYLWI